MLKLIVVIYFLFLYVCRALLLNTTLSISGQIRQSQGLLSSILGTLVRKAFQGAESLNNRIQFDLFVFI